MREIKFRGKSDKYGWVYGNLSYREDDGNSAVFIEDQGFCGDLTPVDRDTIGQYTGLKDEDGVEIFEGDIVKVHEAAFNWSAIGVVIYDPETTRFLIREQNKKYPRDFSFRKHNTYKDGYCTVECESDFHVLGNIHDNPELI